MKTKSEHGSDPLEKVIRLAGRPTPVNPERADQIEKNTRERWQKLLARRRIKRRRRRLAKWSGALAASIVVAVTYMSRPAIEGPFVATVVSVVGAPETGAPGKAMTTLELDASLRAGSVLETDSNDGIGLLLVSGHSLRLAPQSRIRIEIESVVLDVGALYLDSGAGGQATPIEVRSPLASIQELGTQYLAELSEEVLQVSVREGMVRITQPNRVTTGNAGEMVELNGSGQIRTVPVLEYGEHWAWVTQLAPKVSLEDLNLSEFLHWLAREQGWQLEFATTDLARVARHVELFGSIEGLSGEDALSTVMSATRWSYRLENGVLKIESRGTEER